MPRIVDADCPNMHKSHWLRLIFVSAIFCAAASLGSDYTASRAFSVRISINKDSINGAFYENTGTFWVDTAVKDLSSQDRTITIWTQHGWSWISDNPTISPGTEALNNFPTKILLNPGEEYKSRVEIHSDRRKAKPIIFRLGFVPNVDRPAFGVKGIEKREDVVWSNPVRLDR